MTDLVERLRSLAELRYDWLTTNREAQAIALISEAADEIERLRAALQAIDKVGYSKRGGQAGAMQRLARETLRQPGG